MGNVTGHVALATGFNRECACVRGIDGVVAIAGGGHPETLRRRLGEAAVGAAGIVSFGMAGALADGLAIGDWVVADRLTGTVEADCDPAWTRAIAARLSGARLGGFFADGRMIDTVAEKLALGAGHGALAVDMESHVAAAVAREAGLPFAIVRCVSDGARHLLPSAITVSMRPDGGVDLGAMLASLAAHPGQLADVARTTAGFAKAMRELKRGAAALGARMAFPGE